MSRYTSLENVTSRIIYSFELMYDNISLVAMKSHNSFVSHVFQQIRGDSATVFVFTDSMELILRIACTMGGRPFFQHFICMTSESFGKS